VVDDDSPDGTGQIADQLAAQESGRLHVVHRPRKSGFGRAYLAGFAAALDLGVQAVAQMDADLSHSPAKLVELLAAVEQADIAIGSRYVAGGSVDARWTLWRKRLSMFGNAYARAVLGLVLHDLTSGFRVYRSEVLQAMPLERIDSTGYVFQIEMIYLAQLCGYSATEIPIHFVERTWGASKMSLQIQAEAMLRVWQLRIAYRDLLWWRRTKLV
jgi:dolichol-phosphate mannosyltransferase